MPNITRFATIIRTGHIPWYCSFPLRALLCRKPARLYRNKGLHCLLCGTFPPLIATSAHHPALASLGPFHQENQGAWAGESHRSCPGCSHHSILLDKKWCWHTCKYYTMDADDAAQMSFYSSSTEDWHSPIEPFLGQAPEQVKKTGCAVSGTPERHLSSCTQPSTGSCSPALPGCTKCQGKHLWVHQPAAP